LNEQLAQTLAAFVASIPTWTRGRLDAEEAATSQPDHRPVAAGDVRTHPLWNCQFLRIRGNTMTPHRRRHLSVSVNCPPRLKQFIIPVRHHDSESMQSWVGSPSASGGDAQLERTCKKKTKKLIGRAGATSERCCESLSAQLRTAKTIYAFS